eukprot:CAMPEP_0115571706 /NCGR_PEP_ID=MMETSP0272-20121206/85_1 /TAXON_ID=71861 /ORGANISM="Scrippsiella trochoidea, Strain CCMP3099" /LENGTH=1304 /DNA_ID=CAMNT_0003006275 /DNA_START=19 /DNA_END=3929 /DNA_ORIENTATION=-
MSSFTALPQALPLPDQKLVHDAQMRPQYNIVALAELEGSPFVLTGDSKGCISAWSLSLGRSSEEPNHYFEAHTGAICNIIPLRTSRIPELIEEKEWPEDEASGMTAAARAARRRRSANCHVSESEGKDEGEDAVAAAEPVEVGPPKRASLAKRCCSWMFRRSNKNDKQPKAAPRGRENARHWLIATAAEDGAVRVWRWRIAIGQRRAEEANFDVDFVTEWVSEKEQPLSACIELYDGHLAVSRKDCADVLLIDPASATLRWVLFGHTAAVNCFALCADGRLVSGGADGAVRLWAQRAWSWRDESAPGERFFDSAGEDRPAPPALVWAEPGQESAKAGVSSMAFFAHMQQAETSECVALCLRVLVHRAENLPKADVMTQSDPYVSCTVVEGDPSLTTTVRTLAVLPFKEQVTWGHSCQLALRRCLVDCQWTLPECSELDFEIFSEKLRGEDVLLAHCVVSLADVQVEIARSPEQAKGPQAYKLFAPMGQGPFKDLKRAVLYLGFTSIGDNSVGCIIDSADGLPSVGSGTRLYIRCTVRQSITGKARRVPAKLKDKTKVVDNDPNPYFNDILEVEVPVSLRDRAILHGPDVHMLFEVYDYDEGASDDLLGVLSLPMSDVLNCDDGKLRSFNLRNTYKGLKNTNLFSRSPRSRSRKSSSRVFAASGSDSDDSPPPSASSPSGSASGALTFLPQLHLGFLAVMPCPMQLQCVVEQASSMPIPRKELNKVAAQVRMRFVEGNPMLAHLTSFRTSTKKQTVKPIWHERGTLPVPDWLLKATKPPEEHPASVLAEWEHPSVEAVEYAIVVDIYDEDVQDSIYLVGRAAVPFSTAWAAALAEVGVASSRPVGLSTDAQATIWLGFERGQRPDELVVLVDRAEKLPDASGRPDPYCVVRIAELGALGEPPDNTSARPTSKAETDPAPTGLRDPVWRHRELLEMPGGQAHGLVAARPNWHLLFEIVDANSPADAKEPVLAHASVPVTEILSELKQAEPSKPPPGLNQRILNLRSPVGAQKLANPRAEEPDEEEEPINVVRELSLLKFVKKTDMRQASAGAAGLGAKALEGPRALGGGSAPPPQPAASAPSGGGGSSGSSLAAGRPHEHSNYTGLSIGLTQALEGMGSGGTPPVIKDGEGGVLLVRFQALSRWKGAQQGHATTGDKTDEGAIASHMPEDAGLQHSCRSRGRQCLRLGRNGELHPSIAPILGAQGTDQLHDSLPSARLHHYWRRRQNTGGGPHRLCDPSLDLLQVRAPAVVAATWLGPASCASPRSAAGGEEKKGFRIQALLGLGHRHQAATASPALESGRTGGLG